MSSAVSVSIDELPDHLAEFVADEVAFEAKSVARDLLGAKRELERIAVFLEPGKEQCLERVDPEDAWICEYRIVALAVLDGGHAIVAWGATGRDELGRMYVFLDSEILAEMLGGEENLRRLVERMGRVPAIALLSGISALASLLGSDISLEELRSDHLLPPEKVRELERELGGWVRVELRL